MVVFQKTCCFRPAYVYEQDNSFSVGQIAYKLEYGSMSNCSVHRNESLFKINPDSHRTFIWREPGSRYLPSNAQASTVMTEKV
ncbi:hypothetical protein TNCV_2724781 [Trichonephila clavipes]|nr:hypothetical protein TNCV_2724781 [Trichonephila clavipes]